MCHTCKPPSDRHRRTGSTRRSFSRDEGRRLAFRKCRRAWPSRRELKTKAALRACGLLFLARWMRLPRRHMRSRRRIRPDRLRHPRGLRGAAEAQQPCEEMGATLLKHQQDGFWGQGNLYMHVVMHSARILTDGSGETASTPKIVSDVARTSTCRWIDNG